ncbi:TPA: YopX family protein [Bacillus anthracis]|nr:hypothetical protein [Bacillus cereus biovar anthracis]HDR6230955.1 hypothetical protein [Bacillus cereus biovar anthracis]HDR6240482.1 hypothetical protein [Bacillus cereus biovar anthracis]HDR6252426.1 hypothetical protein [Bacillus cereus biovar anthracis]HDR6254211.1 hypothetical protein [Bacillus cereus biovar anthracis]
MREIKFRARDEEFSEMIENPHCNPDNYDGDINFEFRNSKNVIWMQYTGLEDKNGKEIYEGDVVDTVYDGELFTGIVIYDESELDFKATNGQENYGSNFQYLPCCDEVEVIGNIYENPDLLNRKEETL